MEESSQLVHTSRACRYWWSCSINGSLKKNKEYFSHRLPKNTCSSTYKHPPFMSEIKMDVHPRQHYIQRQQSTDDAGRGYPPELLPCNYTGTLIKVDRFRSINFKCSVPSFLILLQRKFILIKEDHPHKEMAFRGGGHFGHPLSS